MRNYSLIEKLSTSHSLTLSESEVLITTSDSEDLDYLAKLAGNLRDKVYGREIYLRGLIEISNICKNDCLYCGIRKSNQNCRRFRLSPKEILECAQSGYELGFRTFVLQGGEDPYYNDEVLSGVIREIKSNFWDCAITLSLGERSFESYKILRKAGADRYLLRHETADKSHYKSLHPEDMSFENRMQCLKNLKALGFQTGCGFMVESPGQTPANIAKDLKFIEEFKPHMCGIGPFIPHRDTPFGNCPSGDVSLTIMLLSIIRLMLPDILLPATTALFVKDNDARISALKAGANVIMPNLSPRNAREKYELYNGKISDMDDGAKILDNLINQLEEAGFNVSSHKGDHKPYTGD